MQLTSDPSNVLQPWLRTFSEPFLTNSTSFLFKGPAHFLHTTRINTNDLVSNSTALFTNSHKWEYDLVTNTFNLPRASNILYSVYTIAKKKKHSLLADS